MREYGKVFSCIWGSSSFRTLSEDGRTLALYLLTCPHGTLAGVFRIPDGYVSEDLQWPSERVSEGFDELLQKGFATRCNRTKWVWVANYLEWNPLENPNQRKSAHKLALSIPDSCDWKSDFMRVCGNLLGIGQQESLNPSERVSEPLPNQEQEQEQEQEQDGVGTSPPDASPAAPPKPKSTGSRLPDDWKLPKAWGEWALAEYPVLTPDAIRHEAACFADYWQSKAGTDARKTNWQKTWQNWIRRAKSHSPPVNRQEALEQRNSTATAGWKPPELRGTA